MADEIIRYKEIYDSAESQAKIKYLMELEKQRSVLGGKAFDDKKAQTKAEVKLWDEIVTAQKRVAAGPSEWTLALRANTAAVTEARGSINKAREATGAFAAALSLLSPEAAAAAQGLQKAEGAAAGLAASGELAGVSVGTITAGLGAAAVAAVPAYLAFRQSAADLEEMDRWVNITAEDLKNLKAGTDTIVEAQFELDRRAQKLRGTMTEQEAATYAAAEAQDVYKGASDALSESLDNQTRRLEEMRRRLSDKTMLETLGDWFNPFSEGSAERLKAINQQAAEVERLKGKVGELDEAEGEYAGTLKGVIIQEERRTSGVKKEKEEIEGLSELLKQIAEDEAAAEKAQASRQKSAERHFKKEQETQKKAAAYYDDLEKRAAATAAEEVAARATVRDALLDQADAAAVATESAFGAETAAGKAAAIAQIAIAEAQLLLAAAKYGPGAPAYIALGQIPIAIAAAKLAGVGEEAPAVTDTPRPWQAGPQGGQVNVAPGDIVIAGRRPQDVQRQAASLGGAAAPGPTMINLQLDGRTIQAVSTRSSRGTRRAVRATPVGQRRR